MGRRITITVSGKHPGDECSPGFKSDTIQKKVAMSIGCNPLTYSSVSQRCFQTPSHVEQGNNTKLSINQFSCLCDSSSLQHSLCLSEVSVDAQEVSPKIAFNQTRLQRPFVFVAVSVRSCGSECSGHGEDGQRPNQRITAVSNAQSCSGQLPLNGLDSPSLEECA